MCIRDSCNSKANGVITKNKGNATRVPRVPGAFLDIPAPKPKARKCQKLNNKNFVSTKVCEPFFYRRN